MKYLEPHLLWNFTPVSTQMIFVSIFPGVHFQDSGPGWRPSSRQSLTNGSVYGAWMFPGLEAKGWNTILNKGEIYNNCKLKLRSWTLIIKGREFLSALSKASGPAESFHRFCMQRLFFGLCARCTIVSNYSIVPAREHIFHCNDEKSFPYSP
jgi:hypothetical protein